MGKGSTSQHLLSCWPLSCGGVEPGLQQLVPSLSHLRAIVVPEAHMLHRCSRGNDAVSLGTHKSRRGVDGGQMSFLSKSVSVG